MDSSNAIVLSIQGEVVEGVYATIAVLINAIDSVSTLMPQRSRDGNKRKD